MMFYPHGGSTRAALLIESIDSKGEKHVLVYHLSSPISMTLDTEYTTMYNVFEGARYAPMPTRMSVEAYLNGPPREWDQQMPAEQEEIEPTNLAIESNESEIVVEYDEYDADLDEDFA